MTKKKAAAPAPQSGGGAIDGRFKSAMRRYIRPLTPHKPKLLIALIVIALAILVIASQLL